MNFYPRSGTYQIFRKFEIDLIHFLSHKIQVRHYCRKGHFLVQLMDKKDRKLVNISSVSYLIYFQNKIVKTPIELSKRDFYSQQLQNIHQEFADTHMNPCNKGQNLTKHSDSLLVTLWYSG